ncbi:MAG: hypothetical protein MUO85_06280 [candidate division Zixibacteria bacterium]|nr:hypothetical protein [candidate division Zixibacteria bacterium]
MYKSFEVIDQFIREISGLSIIEEPMPLKFKEVIELENAYEAIQRINKGKRKPFSHEFIRDVYPFLEVSVQWQMLKKSQSLTQEFMGKCKTRVVRTQDNYYGTIFEIDMATRCLLSNWEPDFVEDYTVPEKQIDFVFNREKDIVGVECLSKRYSENSLTIDRLNKDVSDKGKKFKPEYIKKLGVRLDKRILIIDITTSSYSVPGILKDLEKTELSPYLDAVIYTWREDIIDNENHSLRVKYSTYGDIEDKYFSTTFASEFHVHNGEPVFFVRKYTEPEPTFSFGPEESINDNSEGS